MNFMDKFIKISLTEIGKNYEKLLDNQISVVLGSPGSGKTYLAKHLEKEFNGCFFSVKEFMDFEISEIIEKINTENRKPILILDAFDEYRIFENSKTYTVIQISKKIQKIIDKINNIKIIITCRELDWYGDNDKETLEKYLNLDVKIYYIKSLDDEQIKEFSKLYVVQNEDEFIFKFKDKGFLSTPQLLKISAELANKGIDNKIKLYEEFIKKAILEENNYHKEKLHINKISNDKLIEKLGYMAFFYMFSNIENFDEKYLKEIASDNGGFEYEILEELSTNTKLFKNKNFIHRTFAEFLAAYFIYNYLIKKKKIAKEIIRGLFLNNDFVYTELRGTYAWLCSISQDEYFINFDPFYQLLYGENNHFGAEFKKKIISSIKKYSKEINPYFINPKDFYLKGLLNGFYTEEMDDFIIQEIDEAIKLKNHYLYVFELIIKDNIVSNKLEKFLYKKLYDNNLDEGFKVSVINSQNLDVSRLKEVLNELKINKIKDEDNRIKIAILNKLYPENIEVEEVVETIKTFNDTKFINTCNFLYKTPKEKLIKLVGLLEKELMASNRNNYSFKFFCVRNFLSNFYYELINSYNGENAEEIYRILKKMREYYEPWKSINIEKFNSKIKKLNDEKLTELSNKLFNFYLEDILKGERQNLFLKIVNDFQHFFPLKFPTNIIELCIKKMGEVDDNHLKKELFGIILKFSSKKDLERLEKIAEKHEMKEEFKKFIKQSEEIEESRKKTKNKKIIEIEKNEEYFRKLNKNNFLQDFKAVNFISELIYFDHEIENYISRDTFEKFKNYLKDLVFSEYYDQYIDFEKIYKELRLIDRAFLVSLHLNQNNIEELLKRLKEEKLKYLYLLAIREENTANVNNRNFINKFEKDKKNLAKKTLLETIRKTAKNVYNSLKEYFEKSDIYELKNFLNILKFSSDEIENYIDAFLKVYSFKVTRETLDKMKKEYNSDLLNIFYKFRVKKENLLVEELVKLYSTIYYYGDPSKIFDFLTEDEKIRLALNFFREFDSEDKMSYHDGFQSNLDLTINFVKYNLINFLSLSELKKINEESISEYWDKIIKKTIAEKSGESDFSIHEIRNLKDFVFESFPINEYQFFKKIEIELDDLIKQIERNENNEKHQFWNGNEHKKEEECRDTLINIWKPSDNFSREAQIEKYKVDIEIIEKQHNWKVRIECKVDKNKKLLESLKEQLINKYLNNRETNYGIYLVFCFENKNINKLKEKLEKQIPSKWKEKVLVKLIDLKK